MSWQLPESKYRERLWQLHELYQGDIFERPPEDICTPNCHEKLTWEQILEASVMLSRLLGVSVSGADFDLNKLLQVYLLDLEARTRITKVFVSKASCCGITA